MTRNVAKVKRTRSTVISHLTAGPIFATLFARPLAASCKGNCAANLERLLRNKSPCSDSTVSSARCNFIGKTAADLPGKACNTCLLRIATGLAVSFQSVGRHNGIASTGSTTCVVPTPMLQTASPKDKECDTVNCNKRLSAPPLTLRAMPPRLGSILLCGFALVCDGPF